MLIAIDRQYLLCSEIAADYFRDMLAYMLGLVAPEIFETRWRQLGAAHSVLNVAVAEIVLD